MKPLLNKLTGFYATLLTYVTVAIFLTIVVLSSILYLNYEKISIDLIRASALDDLSHISYSANVMTDAVKTQMIQVYMDPDVAGLFYPNRPNGDQLRSALQRLSMYRSTLPFVHSVYVYNADADMFYSDGGGRTEYAVQTGDEFFDSYARELVHDPASAPIFRPIPRRLPEKMPGYNETQYSNVYSFLYYEPTKGAGSKHTVLFNISETWMRQIIDTMARRAAGDVRIIDPFGTLVHSGDGDRFLSRLGEQAHIRRMLHGGLAEDSFVESVDGEKSLVTYVTSEATGWKFVKITPYRDIVANIRVLQGTTIAVGAIILLLGIALAAFVSKRMSSSVDRIVHKMKNLERKDRRNKDTLRQELLRGVALFGSDESADALQAKFEQLQLALRTTEPFALVLLSIDDYASFSASFGLRDRNLHKYATLNIAIELFSASYRVEGADLGERQLALFLNVPSDESGRWLDDVRATLARVQANVAAYQRLSISACISSAGASVLDAAACYKEAAEQARYLLFRGRGAVLTTEDVAPLKSRGSVYSADKEKQLIHELALGKAEEAKRTYEEMTGGLRNGSIHAYRTTMLRLSLAFGVAAEHFEREYGVPFEFDIDGCVAALGAFESALEADRYFYELCDRFAELLPDQTSEKYDELIRTITGIVEQEYMDANLSVHTLSSAVKMSPVYLGRLFKKSRSMSIASYITDYRMQKAKVLLLSSDLPIGTIAERTGFANGNYFFTLFKKHNGITPNEYRLVAERRPAQ